MIMKRLLPGIILLLIFKTAISQLQSSNQATAFPTNPRDAKFHTEDISTFWKVFDKYYPEISGDVLQQEYLDVGSIGVKGFIKNRIESGKNLSKEVRDKIKYYQWVRPFTVSIDEKKERLYECFENLKKIYSPAVFPDVYFVIGADNTGGAIFDKGLIIGAERYGKANNEFKPALDIESVDEVVAHELIHFQQKYVKDNSLLAQSIREGSADFICELIAGTHSNKEKYVYGDSHKKELWEEFQSRMYKTDWTNWLYYSKDKSREKDMGYWMGYQICKAFYDRMTDKQKAVSDMLNIEDFKKFFETSGYNGE